MRAIRISAPGGPEVLEPAEVARPAAGPGEALVRVRAVGVNRADLLQRRGAYPAPPGWPPDIPGLELAGEVEELGPSAGREGEALARERLGPGDRVMAIVGGGAYAEYAAMPLEHLMPVPGEMELTAAAAIPEVFLTAADALFARGGLERGERALVHSAGGGVGTAALQLARAAGAAGVAGTASAAKLERLVERGLSPDLPIDYRAEDFAGPVLEWTDGAGVDVILDTVGAPYWESNVRCLATLGRLVLVGVLGGSRTEVDLRALMVRRATVVGTVLRARTIEEKGRVTSDFVERFLPAFSGDAPALRPIVDRVLPLEEAAAAHEALERNATLGKVVLEV